jgi:hypothetical protein
MSEFQTYRVPRTSIGPAGWVAEFEGYRTNAPTKLEAERKLWDVVRDAVHDEGHDVLVCGTGEVIVVTRGSYYIHRSGTHTCSAQVGRDKRHSRTCAERHARQVYGGLVWASPAHCRPCDCSDCRWQAESEHALLHADDGCLTSGRGAGERSHGAR